MNSENLLLILAIVAVLVSIVAFNVNYSPNSELLNVITGFANSNGTVNLSVESVSEINFTTSNINFGSGRVYPNSTFALLSSSNGSIAGGNFTTNTAGLIIENIGNANINLSLYAGKDAASFVGGTNPRYEFNVSQSEALSCVTIGNFNFSVFRSLNTTRVNVCPLFNFSQASDVLRIDILIVVPENSNTGALGDTITAVGV